MNKKMSLGVAVLICVLFFGGVIFISNKGDVNMDIAKTGDVVSMNYTGRLEDGTVFDSNVDPAFGHTQPLIFQVGGGQMIPGFDQGVVGMKTGEKKTISIPPEQAYGASGTPDGRIPPNATLIFEIELLSIK